MYVHVGVERKKKDTSYDTWIQTTIIWGWHFSIGVKFSHKIKNTQFANFVT